MKNRILGVDEIGFAAINIRSIERALGGPIPMGMIDFTHYADRILGADEVGYIVINIENIMRARGMRTYRSYSKTETKFFTSPTASIMVFFFLWLIIGAGAVLTIGIISAVTLFIDPIIALIVAIIVSFFITLSITLRK